MMAQGYQESRLDQNAKSRVGAVGIMQLMPATGEQMKVGNMLNDFVEILANHGLRCPADLMLLIRAVKTLRRNITGSSQVRDADDRPR